MKEQSLVFKNIPEDRYELLKMDELLNGAGADLEGAGSGRPLQGFDHLPAQKLLWYFLRNPFLADRPRVFFGV